MLAGIQHLRRAREILRQGSEATLRADVHAAATEFWSAVFHEEHWTASLRARAASLQALLFARGPLPITVNQMTPVELKAARTALLDFVEAMEEAVHDSPP